MGINFPDAPAAGDVTSAAGRTWQYTGGIWVAIETVKLNTQTGTSYTLTLADMDGVVEMNNASANTVTIPPNSSVALPVGCWVDFTQYGAGQTTIAAGAGVTLRASGGALKLQSQYSQATAYKRGTDEWVVSGDLVA